MRRGTLPLLLFIIVLALGAAYVVAWPTKGINGKLPNPWSITEGLDLKGGIQVLLLPTNPKQQPTNDEMQGVLTQISGRVSNAAGVNEPSVRLQSVGGQTGVSVELPGANSGNQEQIINSLKQQGVLEIWNTGSTSVPQGSAFDPTQYKSTIPDGKPLFTGKDLDPGQLGVSQDQQTGQYVVNFAMKGAAFGKLSTYTSANVGNYMTITLDKQVISSPVIQQPLPGSGDIQGNFTLQSATALKNILQSGALPVPMKVESESTVGATLGQDSIDRSLIAGEIGIGIVILFMLLYYRLPGFLADLALIMYTLFTFAIFKLIGVTLTLAGIAGFILSIGMAVDANVLIFERIKEELRAGRLLASAIDVGWRRAWPSIRDSNISTLITCSVLYAFGSNFGATIIVGFASTLAIGVAVSMFTAVVVTRTLLNLLVPTGAINHPAFFGLPAGSIATASLGRRNGTL
ncbi:MAG: protein translocase subunit SecD [Ktedonobacteraceae bacterium]|nr:protein translocase subunit SecD [Ktedonobacteraceae bacterium]